MRRSRIAAAAFLVLVGCSSTRSAEKLPDKPPMKLEPIPEVPASGAGSIVPLPAPGEATPEEARCIADLGVPADGFVLSESKYESVLNLRLTTEKLHTAAIYNSSVCEIWTDSIWTQLKTADESLDTIAEERSTWWYQNKDTVIFGSGFTLGAAAAILIVYGVNQAQKTE